MFAKRLGMRTIARSPSGFVTCDIITRARVKERESERVTSESQREIKAVSKGCHTRGEKRNTNAHPPPRTSITFPPFTSSTRHTTSPSFSLISTSKSWTCARTCFRLALIYLYLYRERKQRENKSTSGCGVTRARVFFCPNWNLKNLRHNFTEHRARSLTSPSTF